MKRIILNLKILSILVAAVLLSALAGGCGSESEAPEDGGSIKLATTTSTYDSGLLDALLPVFTGETGIEVQVLSRGTGQALELGKRGDADVLLVHDRATALQLVAEGYFTDRYDVMYNDFVILGPAADPAGLARMESAVEALEAIAAGSFAFISRGDDSGANRLELRLWEKAGIDPDPGSDWYFAVGRGMSDTMIMAHEKEAYTIADRGTYLTLKDRLDLAILLEGDPVLFNQYGVMAVNPAKHPHVQYTRAVKFIEFLTSVEGRELIASFMAGGETLFFPGMGLED